MKRSFVLLLSFCAATLGAVQPARAVSSNLNEFEAEVLQAINAQRAQAGLAVLLEDLSLNEAARAHSEDMAAHGCFSHDSCDGTPWEARIRAYYTPATSIGEIVAAGFSTPEAVMAGWLNSPGHKADILEPAFKVAGVGLVDAEPGAPFVTYWTVDFGGEETPRTVPLAIPEPGSGLLMALGLGALLLAWRSQRSS